MTPNVRFGIILICLFLVLAVLCFLLGRLHDLRKRLDSEHRRSTHVATVRGLIESMQLALRNGGLSPETREQIYLAIADQFDRYDNEFSTTSEHRTKV